MRASMTKLLITLSLLLATAAYSNVGVGFAMNNNAVFTGTTNFSLSSDAYDYNNIELKIKASEGLAIFGLLGYANITNTTESENSSFNSSSESSKMEQSFGILRIGGGFDVLLPFDDALSYTVGSQVVFNNFSEETTFPGTDVESQSDSFMTITVSALVGAEYLLHQNFALFAKVGASYTNIGDQEEEQGSTKVTESGSIFSTTTKIGLTWYY